MKDVFIVWFGFVFTETQLAVKKISMSKRDSSLKTSHRSMAVGSRGRAEQWMSMCAGVLLRWGKYSGIAQWWWLDVPNNHWVAHFNRANYTVWLASQWQTQEGRLEPSLSAVDSGCFCFRGWLCFPMSVCAQTPSWRIWRLHYHRGMSQRPFQPVRLPSPATSDLYITNTYVKWDVSWQAQLS